MKEKWHITKDFVYGLAMIVACHDGLVSASTSHKNVYVSAL